MLQVYITVTSQKYQYVNEDKKSAGLNLKSS